MPTHLQIALVVLVVLVICLPGHGVYAFGAGNIPSFAYMEGRAFRHGDIEDTLSDLVKKVSGGFALGSLIGKGGSKFGGLDVKRVYFGNWLRDYSQAVDIGTLKKLPLQTILNLCMALGFLAHGYATAEFEVTEERLGIYLPVEHIDNPKGYGEGEDARQYHPKLRGPVDPRELEVDPRTGMKNYIANEDGPWDTSKGLVRRLLQQCIHFGRQHRAQGRKQDEYEAYRLLGTLLHTLEDFSAHSNFCELALVSMGHQQVFTHIGDGVKVRTASGQMVTPLVTGTFGGSDFIYSLMGEATDHISEASVTDLNRELNKARSMANTGERGIGGSSKGPADVLRDLFFTLPGSAGGEMTRDMESIERIRAGPSQGGKTPDQMSPQELHAVLWQVLSFRDSVVKKIENTIEKIPGLGPLINKLMESIQVFIFTTLEPFLVPILKSASAGLMSASSEVINTHDQYEVFNDPMASDPTHSFLSKDHFNLILNEPAGKLAKVVVSNTVQLVVRAWDDNKMNVQQLTEEVLQCMFHPDFHMQNSKVQREMLQSMREWVTSLGPRQGDTLRRLGKEAVRNHENVRQGEHGQNPAQQSFGYSAGVAVQHDITGFVGQIPGVAQAQNIYNHFSPGPGGRRDMPDAGPGAFPGAQPHAHHQSSFGPGGPGGPPPIPQRQDSGQSTYPGAAPAQSSYAPPGGPPPFAMPTSPGGYGGPGGRNEQPGYAPSYNPGYASPPPSFPGGPGGIGGGGGGGYGPPPGPPPGPGYGGFAPTPGPQSGYPGQYGPPGGPPPQFPGSPPHPHHQQSGYGGPPPPQGGGYQGGW